jgi:prephenate dehydrogenase
MGNTITIVGAAGKMGKWFFDYFINIKNNNCSLYRSSETFENNNRYNTIIDKILLCDIKKINYIIPVQQQGKEQNIDKEESVIVSTNISECIKASDIIIFCTPLNEIINLININFDVFKRGSVIIEISSIKTAIHGILSSISSKRDLTTLCIHPMFGPGASILSSNNKIIFIPVNKNKRKVEENLIKDFFPDFERIKIEEPHNHDISISVIISIIYFINLVFSKLLIGLSNEKEFQFEEGVINFFKKISGSSFKIQSLLSESILTDDLSLFNTLFIDNTTSLQIFQKYNHIFNQLLDKVEKKDKDFLKDFIQTVKDNIKKDSDIYSSYEMLYKFINVYHSK